MVLFFTILTYAISSDKFVCRKSFLRSFAYLISFCIILFFNGLRYYVGKDYIGYLNYFDGFTMLQIEPSFILITIFFRNFNHGFYYLIFTCTFITYFLFYRSFISDKVTYIGLGIFLLLFMPLFNNIIRQAIAVSVFYYSVKFIHQKNFLKYFFLILIAASFHYSAIFLLPLYFIRKLYLNFSISLITILLVIVITISVLHTQIIKDLLMSIPFYGDYILGIEGDSRNNSEIGVLLKIILGIQILYLSKKIDIEYFGIYRNLLLIGIFLTILGSSVSILSRFTNYFYISIIYLSSEIFKNKFKNKNLHLIIVIIIAFALFEAEFIYNRNYSIPYKSIMQVNK